MAINDYIEIIMIFVGRLFIGVVAWGVGAAALFAFVLLSAIPYGGGSGAPLIMVVPWTAVVIYWVVRPLRQLPILSSPATVPLIFAVMFCSAIGSMYWWSGSGKRERANAERAFASTFEPHSTYFRKVCAKAGSMVFRQVRDVDGIVAYGIRTKRAEWQDLSDRDFVGDVYSEIDTSHDPEASFVRNFLTRREWDARSHTPSVDETTRYPLVEIPAELDGISGFYRYTDASVKSEQKTTREFVTSATSSYAIHIEDISSVADREHWIAGVKWSVVDVRTKEVLGEFIAFAIDPLQGKTVFKGGSGSAGQGPPPWGRAGDPQWTRGIQNVCPGKDPYRERLRIRDFVRSVLVPVNQEVKIIPAR